MNVTFLNLTLDVLYLGLGLALLWFPRQWLRYGAFRRRARAARAWAPNRDREPGDLSVWLGEEAAKMRNWVDFFRALAGGAAVWGTLIPTVAALKAPSSDPQALRLLLGLKIVLLLIGLALQTVRPEERVSLFAPIFYLQGLAFGLLGYKAALLAICLAWTVNAVLPSAGVLLTVFAFLEILAGVFFGQPKRECLVAAGLALLPVLASIMFRRRLAQFTKRTKIIAGPSSSRG